MANVRAVISRTVKTADFENLKLEFEIGDEAREGEAGPAALLRCYRVVEAMLNTALEENGLA